MAHCDPTIRTGTAHTVIKPLNHATRRKAATFLGRVRRDVRGNTLAIVAAALIPLIGIVGGGIDLSRLYITKTRMQHACDAGALAGRKAMGGGIWGSDDLAAANSFFNANFASGSYGSTDLKTAFTEHAGKVTGTVSTVLPMTLMRVLDFNESTLNVTCQSEMRLPNTDVMFVLDTTGSMGSKAVSGDTQTKIEALKSSVKCFYEIVARLDTDENCIGGAPSGGVSDQVQVRFGFVPYATNVNVGRLLPTKFVADSWTYQSREPAQLYGTFYAFAGNNTRNASAFTGYQNTSTSRSAAKPADCNNSLVPLPNDTFTPNGTPAWPVNNTETDAGWLAWAPYTQRVYNRDYNPTTKTCTLQFQERSIERYTQYSRSNKSASGAFTFPAWSYKQITHAVSGLKSGSGWNSSVSLPVGTDHTTVPVMWDGCIEERATVRQASYTPIPAKARDLDIDALPTSSDQDSLWGPALPGAVFARKVNYTNTGAYTLDTVTNFQQNYTGDSYACPTPAHKLQEWQPDAFDGYVDSLQASGNTYHDIGLIWGARLMSPTGMFASENALTPKGGEIQRNMIFMTDGESCTDANNYQAYGFGWFDRRQTDPDAVPTSGCGSTGTLTQQVNARTAAVCAAVKNKNITLWVIWFGASSATIEKQMKDCATPGRYFAARNQADLQNTFRSIANQISQLRLTN